MLERLLGSDPRRRIQIQQTTQQIKSRIRKLKYAGIGRTFLLLISPQNYVVLSIRKTLKHYLRCESAFKYEKIELFIYGRTNAAIASNCLQAISTFDISRKSRLVRLFVCGASPQSSAQFFQIHAFSVLAAHDSSS